MSRVDCYAPRGRRTHLARGGPGQRRSDWLMPIGDMKPITAHGSYQIAHSAKYRPLLGRDQYSRAVKRAEAADTDLFVVSLGGNDFLYYVQGPFSACGMDAIIGALDGGAESSWGGTAP